MRHTATPWVVTGPIRKGHLGQPESEFKYAGFGIRGAEPKQFGGTVIAGLESELQKHEADFICLAVNSHNRMLESLKEVLAYLNKGTPIHSGSLLHIELTQCLDSVFT